MKFAKSVIAIVSCAAAIAACSSHGGDSSSSEDVGQASVAIEAAPPDAACVEIDVTGARNLSVRKDVMPGQPTVFMLNGLPIGTDTFSGATFAVPCVQVPTQVPNWLADPVQAFLSIGSAAQVTLNMHRNGQASVGVNYTDDDGGAQCPTGSSLCSGMCIPTQTDPNNCGACGTACQPGASCVSGVCASSDAASDAAIEGNLATLCVSTGGTVSTAMCCITATDFPSTCATGLCSCPVLVSQSVQTCQCPNPQCFTPQQGCH